MNLADLGNTVDEIGDLLSEHLGELFKGRQGVLNRVMEESGNHRWNIQPQISKNGRNFHRMHQVRLAGKPCLPLMDLGAVNIGLADKIKICRGVIGRDLAEDVIQSDHGILKVKERRRLVPSPQA